MATWISLHPAKITGKLKLKAAAGWTEGAPLNIDVIEDDGGAVGRLTIFTHDYRVASLLAQAINEALTPTPASILLEAAE